MKKKSLLLPLTLSIGLVFITLDLQAADRGQTDIAAKVVAGAVIFGGIAMYRAIKHNRNNKKKLL